MLRPALVALSAVLLLPACGSDVEETKGTTGQTTTPNEEPVWNDAPTAPVALGQGQTIELSLAVEDPDGDTVTATAAPPAGLEVETSTSASGASVLTLHADYTLSGASSFDITFDDGRGGTATTTVAVEIAPIRWLENPTWTEAEGPEAREHGSLIVDPDGTQTFLFGGSGYTPYLEPFNDAWRYDTAAGTWSPVTPAGDVPAPGGSRRVAHIPGQKVAYLFGGYGGNQGATTFGDLYRVTIEGQGLTFKLLTQTTPPPKRALHAFAYDPGTDRFVIFGGASTALLNDTWIGTLAGDSVAWEKLTTDPTPSKRYGFFSGFDAERGRLIVFSGAQGFATIDPARDTWALDMRADPPKWELLAEGDTVPPGRRNGCAVFDPTGPRLFVFGGTADAMTTEPGLFAFDARPGKPAWAELALADEPTLRSSGIGFFDASRGRTLLGFGNTSNAVFRDWGHLGY